MAEALHQNCVACRAKCAGTTGEHETMAMLVMVLHGISFEQLHDDLCFAHRHTVDVALAAWRLEGG